MKVAMIGQKRIPSREGGVEIVVTEISTRLVKNGIRVDAYNRKGHHNSGKEFDKYLNKKRTEYNGVKIINIPTFNSKQLNAFVYSFVATIISIFKRYDCIHYHAEGPSAMLIIPHIFRIKTVVTIHGLDWQRKKWNGFAVKYLKLGEYIAARYADEIIVLSRNVKEYFKNKYNRDVYYIPNGIKKPDIKSDYIINSKFKLKKNDYIAFVSRIVPEKGLHFLIDAFKQINTNKKLVIVGGSSDSEEYMSSIIKKSQSDKRIILTNFLQGEELESIYSNAYIYVLPSDIEGMSISLLEAMSYGNCCLVSDIPENKEVVEDKAVLFKKGDTLDLKEKLEYLLKNENIVNEYKLKSCEYICKKYNWDDTTKKTIEIYNKFIGMGMNENGVCKNDCR